MHLAVAGLSSLEFLSVFVFCFFCCFFFVALRHILKLISLAYVDFSLLAL